MQTPPVLTGLKVGWRWCPCSLNVPYMFPGCSLDVPLNITWRTWP
jgi:hypothetical protein